MRLHKILTINKLRRRNHIIINGCPMCLEDEETVHHLLIHCPFAHRVWSALFEMFGMEWVMPRTLEDLFVQWHWRCKFIRGKILLEVSSVC